MCIRFEEGLNDEIIMMIGGTEIREFIVLSDPLPVKKSKEKFSQATSALERSGKSRPRQSDYKVSDRPAVSVEEVKQKEKQKTPPQKGRRSGQSNATGATRSGMKDTASRSEVRAPAHTYAIRAREEATAPDVIADPGSTHSCIFTMLTSKKNLCVKPTDYDVQVANPLGQSVVVNLICHNCSLKVKGCDFPTDLMLLPFREFDIILGIDWLMKHDAKLLRKGNEAYSAYVLDARSSESKLEQLFVVNEFMDLFPEELPGLPPDREVEFVIDMLPGIAPISMTPYRMAPAELKELKT
ncbi:uncharacterized protein LOC108475161 [Gossypium arboreum]|uniref:uncharacterized protein LOC108475161 n=1 Tax=Gossypium arboreum TaxID=29729 RepID=UPI0022F15B26|nr:uncharacterized protein LOC108475161 [Gossypium arboreum]